MPLHGTLKCMPLPDLLQWLGNTHVTGSLRLERDRVRKYIHLSDGLIIACSSDDPPQRLGHFLLSRGKISEEQLRAALHLQEISGQHLGMLLVELGALAPGELSDHLKAQAEETIYSLFDWDDAAFRFDEDADDPVNVFPVGLRVEDVLLRGLKRYDEMREIREVFNDPGIVLEKTGKKAPATLKEDPMRQSLWELVNGDRTVAEILLQVHGSEYVVKKLLFELYGSGQLKIAGVKPIAEQAKSPAPEPALVAEQADAEQADAEQADAEQAVAEQADAEQADAEQAVAEQAVAEQAVAEQAVAEQADAEQADADAATAAGGQQPEPATDPGAAEPAAATIEPSVDSEQDPEDLLADFDANIDLPAAPETVPPDAPEPESEPGEGGLVSVQDSPEHQLELNLEKARHLMSESQFEQALEILDKLYREHPGDESLRRLTAEAEMAFVEKAYRHYLPPSKIPVLRRESDSLKGEDLSPSEFFLLSRIDGTWDIKSIIQIAPLRESEALRALKRMRENGLIELQDP